MLTFMFVMDRNSLLGYELLMILIWVTLLNQFPIEGKCSTRHDCAEI